MPTGCQIHSLEPRVLLAATPEQVLTSAMRQTLLDELELRPSLRNSLNYKLRTSDHAGFDQQLLDYMRDHGAGKFFFDTDAETINDYADYINEKLNPAADVFSRADKVLANLYPEQDSSVDYTVAVPADVDWDHAGYSSNPETVHALNRQSFWPYLAMAHRLSGDDAYADRIIAQLGDWSAESPALADPRRWDRAGPQWNRLNTAVRAESWSWTYSLMLSSPRWTGAANTLFLVKVLEHAQYLYRVTPAALTTNHSLSHGQGLLYLAQLFPEFAGARAWENHARDLLFRGMDAQLFDDGSHVEQSPNYSAIILGWLVETKQLDARNGDQWPQRRSAKLSAAIEAYHQILSPDGATPAIGDSYRRSAVSLWLKSNLVQEEARWPFPRPRSRDAWLLGPDAVRPFESNPVSPPLAARASTYALQDSGNYIMRSGSDPDARQINFDAGPRGGTHGHFDLFSFEFFGYGRPLIADPGPYQYDTSARRAWAVSTPAHNTISIDGVNHTALEGADNTAFRVHGWNVQDDFVQITARHDGYAHLRGAPVVSRSIWYDYDNTMLIVDWIESTHPHDLKSSFLIPGTSTARDLAAGWIRSTHAEGGNVKVQAILQPGQRATYRTSGVFASHQPPPSPVDAATQFFVYDSAASAVFATLITAYEGTSPPDVTASLSATPLPGKRFSIRLNDQGRQRDITFTPPHERLDANATSRGTFNDIAFDRRGRLHLAYFDRDHQNLKYAVRGTDGRWSAVQTIDNQPQCGFWPSLAIDSRGRVGIAYTDANHGDLKYALHDGRAWRLHTVDSTGSTGHYPSLAFGRDDRPVVTYYDKTRGDLRIASGAGDEKWRLRTLDPGSVGRNDVGRFSDLVLDPARTDADHWAVVYEDTSGGRYLYSVTGKLPGGTFNSATGFTTFTVASAPKLGGYASLAFDAGHRPHVSFYDSASTSLRFAASGGSSLSGVGFSVSTVTNGGAAGYYSNLFLDDAGRANVFYFDRTRSKAMRSVFDGRSWSASAVATGGRAIHLARFRDTVAVSSLDEAVPALQVLLL